MKYFAVTLNTLTEYLQVFFFFKQDQPLGNIIDQLAYALVTSL